MWRLKSLSHVLGVVNEIVTILTDSKTYQIQKVMRLISLMIMMNLWFSSHLTLKLKETSIIRSLDKYSNLNMLML